MTRRTVGVSDFVKIVPEQISPWVPGGLGVDPEKPFPQIV